MSPHKSPNPVPDFASAESFILSKLQKDLSPKLCYHNADHTLDVLESAMRIAEAEGITGEDIGLLRVAVGFHDAGFLFVYARHEEKGCEMARQYLPAFGFSSEQIQTICSLILATRFPQRPGSLLEQIIADADLDYLGREEVYSIAKRLFEELKMFNKITDNQDWNDYQVRSLQGHQYHTHYSRTHRLANKEKYLGELMARVK